MLINKKVGIMCMIVSCFSLVGCDEVTRMAKNEINSVTCDSVEARNLLQNLFQNNLSEFLKDSTSLTQDSFLMELSMIHTIESKVGSARKSCSANAKISLPVGFLHEVERLRKEIIRLNEMEIDNEISLNSINENVYNHLHSYNFEISNNDTLLNATIQYDLVVSDDGKMVEVKMTKGLSPFFNLISLHNKQTSVEVILTILDKKIEEQQRLETLNEYAQQLLSYSDTNGQSLLNSAYELSFGNLKFRNADIVEKEVLENGNFLISIRLNYLNLMDVPHYITFSAILDKNGEMIKVDYTDYSDIIQPNSLTFESIIRGLKGV